MVIGPLLHVAITATKDRHYEPALVSAKHMGDHQGRTARGGSQMQTNEDHTVEVVPTDYSYVFNPYREPIARVKPGERVTIHTDDAFESRITRKEDLPSRALATAKFLNPQSGPIYVEGAEPGDP